MDLETPYTMIISGQTGSGKTVFVEKLLRNQAEMHDNPFDQIIFAYYAMQPIYLRLQSEIPNLTLVEGFPDTDFENLDGRTLLVLDDLMLSCEKDSRVASLFTRMRHYNVSTIFVMQNLYHEGRYMRTITRNAHYLVIFPNPRDMGMILTLGRQIFPMNSKFLPDAFLQATKDPYGYLFIDLKPGTDSKFRLRQNIFPDEQSFVFLPK